MGHFIRPLRSNCSAKGPALLIFIGAGDPTSPRREASLFDLPGAFVHRVFLSLGWPKRLNKRDFLCK